MNLGSGFVYLIKNDGYCKQPSSVRLKLWMSSSSTPSVVSPLSICHERLVGIKVGRRKKKREEKMERDIFDLDLLFGSNYQVMLVVHKLFSCYIDFLQN